MSTFSSNLENPTFTFQEVKVILLIKQGLSSKEIAIQLHVAETTIKTHRRNIMKKAGLKGKTAFTQFIFSFISPNIFLEKNKIK